MKGESVPNRLLISPHLVISHIRLARVQGGDEVIFVHSAALNRCKQRHIEGGPVRKHLRSSTQVHHHILQSSRIDAEAKAG